MRTSSRTLYLHAHTLWSALDDTDPKSIRYKCAENQITLNTDGPASVRESRWVTRLHTYEAFWIEYNKAPRENTRDRRTLPDEERRLGEWARYQRRNRPKLCLYQTIRLDVSPAFEWDPQTTAWNRNFTKCRQYLETNGTLPILDIRDPGQFALARWLGRQLDLQRRDLLPLGRALLIDSLIRIARIA